MMKYEEPNMEIISMEHDTIVCSNITGNYVPGDNGGESYEDWIGMPI